MSKFFLMIDYEQSAGEFNDLHTARIEGQKLCDAQLLGDETFVSISTAKN